MSKSSQERQAGVDVTSAMIRAGVDALAGFSWEMDSALQTVAEVYRAMETERRRSNPDAFDLETAEGTARAIS